MAVGKSVLLWRGTDPTGPERVGDIQPEASQPIWDAVEARGTHSPLGLRLPYPFTGVGPMAFLLYALLFVFFFFFLTRLVSAGFKFRLGGGQCLLPLCLGTGGWYPFRNPVSRGLVDG